MPWAEIVNKVRPRSTTGCGRYRPTTSTDIRCQTRTLAAPGANGTATYVVLDGSDHGFRKTSSLEDSFRRWNSPGGEFNPQNTTTLREWIEKVP